MTSARYDTRRRALGLSVREAAALHRCTERTVNRWNAGALDVEADAWNDLDDLEKRMEAQVAALVDLVTDCTMAGPAPLTRYRSQEEMDASPHDCDLPLGAHAIMIAWADDQLAAQGIKTLIGWAVERL